MKVLLDTNIIMDALQERAPFDKAAKEILRRAQDDAGLSAMFTANAAADIFYLYSKARNAESAKVVLSFLIKRFGAVSVTEDDCVAALALPIADFEDALAVVCAKKADADYLITRDDEFLQAVSSVPLIDPVDFLTLLSK